MGRNELGARTASLAARTAVVLIAGLMFASGALARAEKDVCAAERGQHIAIRDFHCGAVFAIPGHHVLQTPVADMPPVCNTSTETLVLTHLWPRPQGSGFDYWTSNGDGTSWTNSVQYEVGEHKQPIGVRPTFRNSTAHVAEVRVFFQCDRHWRR